MRKFLLLLLSFLISEITFAQEKILPVEPGVSLELATYRKTMISDVTYQLAFNIPADRKQAIKASVAIDFKLKDNKQPLQIDFKQDVNHVERIEINQSTNDNGEAKQEPINLKNEHLVIGTKHLRLGENHIVIAFTAGDASLNRNDDYLYALFVPDHARTVFPCFDQPDIKARFRVMLSVPNDWKVLTNGAKTDSSVYNDHVEYKFHPSDLLPTYLFSFTAGKFTTARKQIDSREAEFLYRETDKQKIQLSVDSVFDQHREAIRFLEGWTDIKYPFQKVGFVAIPDFQFGGMEHPGAVEYKASALFLDDAATKDAHIARINLISHETAHMWFGDMVTMRWFNDVWMKEVFANFMADKVTEKLMGTETFNLKFLQDHYPAAYGVDRTPGANPIRQQLDNLQDAGSMYGNIIYHKAPVMMRQLELLMGADNFKAGVREYLKKYAYANATWPDLINILSKHTTANLNAWNKVWVNETGRPVFNADVQYADNKISKFTIGQHPETGENRVWPQVFSVALVYADHQELLTIDFNQQKLNVREAIGKPKPLYIVYNANGMGYGVFPADKSLGWKDLFNLASPIQRASTYINLYENMLNGAGSSPAGLMQIFEKGLQTETEETNLRMLANYISSIYWGFLKPEERTLHSSILEQTLWAAMQQQIAANNKKILFNAYQNIYTSDTAAKRIYDIWQAQTPPQGVKLTEDDYTSIALSIALKCDTAASVLTKQAERITNADRKKRLVFLMPALSAIVNVRDSFFQSLKERKSREKEAWVLSALSYLHHPLRQASSAKYIPESLNILEEIQATGDIFFPQGFINATLGSYQTKEIAQMVDTYVKAHPNLNPKLKGKLLQGADNVKRAQRLIDVNGLK